MSMSCSGDINVNSGIPQAMSQSFDSPGLMYSMNKKQGDGEKEIRSSGYYAFFVSSGSLDGCMFC